MLPDIRVVIVAVAAAIGLLAMSFALAASFRVAQDRSSPLQMEIAQRSRLVPAMITEVPAAPAWDEAPEAAEIAIAPPPEEIMPLPVREVVARIEVAPAKEPPDTETAAGAQESAAEKPADGDKAAGLIGSKDKDALTELAALALPQADPPAFEPAPAAIPEQRVAEFPLGGPAPDQIAADRARAAAERATRASAARAAKVLAARIAAEKRAAAKLVAAAKAAAAQKVRAARIVRARRIAARRAAAARTAQQTTSDPFNTTTPQANSFGAPRAATPRQKGLSGTFSNTFGQ